MALVFNSRDGVIDTQVASYQYCVVSCLSVHAGSLHNCFESQRKRTRPSSTCDAMKALIQVARNVLSYVTILVEANGYDPAHTREIPHLLTDIILVHRHQFAHRHSLCVDVRAHMAAVLVPHEARAVAACMATKLPTSARTSVPAWAYVGGQCSTTFVLPAIALFPIASSLFSTLSCAAAKSTFMCHVGWVGAHLRQPRHCDGKA